MSPIRLNFDQKDNGGGGFDPLPVGAYDVRVTDASVQDSKSSAYQYINWELTVIGGDYKNRKLWTITSLSPKAAWKMNEVLIAFGEDPKKLVTGYELDLAKFIGATCIAKVDIESYDLREPDAQGITQGQRNTVTQLLPPKPAIAGGPSRLK